MSSQKIAIVTGSNTGCGYASTIELAQKGWHVIMACRTQSKALDAISQIKSTVPKTADNPYQLEFMALDLSSFESVKAFAQAYIARDLPLHCLVNNGKPSLSLSLSLSPPIHPAFPRYHASANSESRADIRPRFVWQHLFISFVLCCFLFLFLFPSSLPPPLPLYHLSHL